MSHTDSGCEPRSPKQEQERLRKEKARLHRYKKAIVKDLNWDAMTNSLWEIWEECGNVQYYMDMDDETLLDALDGDEDDAMEFKMMFSFLSSDTERMVDDLKEWEDLQRDTFDRFFAGIGVSEEFGGMLGFDSYESDYFGLIDGYEQRLAQKEQTKKLMRYTKQELIDTAAFCFKVAVNYLSIQSRYQDLKTAMDILKGENSRHLELVKELNEEYEKEVKNDCFAQKSNFDSLLDALPRESWL